MSEATELGGGSVPIPIPFKTYKLLEVVSTITEKPEEEIINLALTRFLNEFKELSSKLTEGDIEASLKAAADDAESEAEAQEWFAIAAGAR
jgi:hypothetical protein